MDTYKPTRSLLHLNTHEMAWAAGFFDGEGTVCLSNRKKTYPQISLQVAQSDRRPLDRFASALGLTVRGPYCHKGNNPNHRPYFVAAAQGFDRVKEAIDLLWPWLSEPKREQASAALATFEPYALARQIHGIGRSTLSLEQVLALRAEYVQLGLGRQRIPKGARRALVEKYGLGSVHTLSAIVAGRGYADRKEVASD